jgi:hypothetical protein
MDNGKWTMDNCGGGAGAAILLEVIAKPQKRWVKPMGQDVHMGRKINNGAALAASVIVNCPLSIVNFLGFATGSLEWNGLSQPTNQQI